MRLRYKTVKKLHHPLLENNSSAPWRLLVFFGYVCILLQRKKIHGILICQVMWYLITALFIFTAHTAHGCVMTSPDQTVNAGTDVYLMCNFTQCPGLLDPSLINVEWQFQFNTSFQSEEIIFQVGNQISECSSRVCHLKNVMPGSFDIILRSVTHEDNGTYVCRLRHDGSIYKNHTQLTVYSAPMSRRIIPVVNNVEAHPPRWWVFLVSLAGIVLLICAVFFGRRAHRQRETIIEQNIEENETRSQTADIRYKVNNNSVSVDLCSPPSTPNADNIYVTMAKNNCMPTGNMAKKPSTSNADNIYVTMHGFPFTTTAPVKPGLKQHISSDWKSEDEEPVSAHYNQNNLK